MTPFFVDVFDVPGLSEMGQNETLLNRMVLVTLQKYTKILKVSGVLKPQMLQFQTQIGIIKSNAPSSGKQGLVDCLKSISSLIDEIIHGMSFTFGLLLGCVVVFV